MRFMQAEVFVHDRREHFSNLGFLNAEMLVLFPNTKANFFVRPEVIQKLNRKENSCIMDDDYSYTRVSTDLAIRERILFGRNCVI